MRGADEATAAELPIACTLDAGDAAARFQQWRALSQRFPSRARRSGHQLEISWQLDGRAANELEALAAAERECCAFVTWSVSRRDPYSVLTITADSGRPEDLDAITALFAAG